MSKPEISLETRASSAYVQGRLQGVLDAHIARQAWNDTCEWISDILKEWKQAEAELQAQPTTPWDYEARSQHEEKESE